MSGVINGLISDVSLQANMPNMSPFHLFFYLQITFGLITAVGHTNKKFYKILAQIKALTIAYPNSRS